MTEEVQSAPGEAEETPIVETEATEGQEQDPPAEGSEPEDKTDEKSESQKRRERRKAYEQRLLKEADEARREAEETRKRLGRIKSAYEGDAAPRESDFSDVIEYAAASALFKQRQADARREESAIEDKAKEYDQRAEQLKQERVRELVEALEDQKAEARTKYADFDKVFNSAFIPQHVADVVLESDVSADIAYFLGQRPALAREISQMPPLAMARQIGRIEASLSAPKPKTVTDAPAPINPVRGQSSATRDPEKMSYEEYRAARAAGKIK